MPLPPTGDPLLDAVMNAEQEAVRTAVEKEREAILEMLDALMEKIRRSKQ